MAENTDVERNVAGEETGDKEIHELFERFARAFTHGDTEAIAQIWGVPSLVMHEGTSRAVGSLGEVKQFFGDTPAQYNKQGVVDTRAEVERIDWATDLIVLAKVRWPYLDQDGREVGEERSTYVVMRDGIGGPWKIWAAVMQGVTLPH